MTVCTPISICARKVGHLSRWSVQRQMRTRIYTAVSQPPSSSCCFSFSTRHSEPKYTQLSLSKTNSCLSVNGFQAFDRNCFGSTSTISKPSGNSDLVRIRSMVSCGRPHKTCVDISLGCRSMNLRVLVPKKGIIPRIKCNVGPVSWKSGCASTGLCFGLLVCGSSSEPVRAEAAEGKDSKEDGCGSSYSGFYHGKKVYTDYSITGIPGDGRCLFRSVAHGACLRSGKPALSESIQRELADELRAKVADEFVKRREETEWFIEGDFDTYVSHMRKPHVWGGEPELFMASHVLQMPITVYMHDHDSGGLISIAEYGQEYGKENPIQVLYHGFGHYDALQIPRNKGSKSRL